MSDEKKIINLTIFLMKDDVDNLEDYLKESRFCTVSQIKPEYGIDGIICYPDTANKIPKWKDYIEMMATNVINIGNNSSNKVVIFAKISNKVLAVVFGYGRSLLKENLIEKNFGLKVALNIIDPRKMKSVQAATVEDLVVTTQRQASYSVAQEEFGLNLENDIMRGVTGQPDDNQYGNVVTGKDTLSVAVFMTLGELKSKLELYVTAYFKDTYKSKGFEWVDNVKEVKDELLIDTLDFKLTSVIEDKNTDNLYIAPAEIVDWEKTTGFCFGGIGKNKDDAGSYTLEINLMEYLQKIDKNTNIYAKIKRDKLYAIASTEEIYSTGNVYNSLIFQTKHEDNTYILVSGNWYRIDTNFHERVYLYVKNRIPVATIILPSCQIGENEGDYNKRTCDNNPDFDVMDCKLVSVSSGRKEIEACDIFTINKQFIHVKNKGKSAQLSHLFSQGKISAQCFVSDEDFRKQVYEKIKDKLGESVLDPANKPKTNEYEVIFAIIDSNIQPVCDSLPFFSLLNLMATAQELERMHVKCSVIKIFRE
ncbi:MAG: TIGR04141 family sporadically distributed protein [Firmicutes bacterium]|nr:TIGR04141 family sporadically distributed protein [Bacillota bacterium]